MYLHIIGIGGPQIVRIQTVQFHYRAVNFLVPNIRFYSEISEIPCNSAIFDSHTSIDSNSTVLNSTRPEFINH